MTPKSEPLIQRLQIVIRWSVRAMAVMMVFVIVMGVVDVAWTIWQKMTAPPRFIMTIADILATFGAFMAVLIAIEIFINITIYLREEVIHVKIVMATALMAVARKVIILDLEKTEPLDMFGFALLIITASIAYWLVHKTPAFSVRFGEENAANGGEAGPAGPPANDPRPPRHGAGQMDQT